MLTLSLIRLVDGSEVLWQLRDTAGWRNPTEQRRNITILSKTTNVAVRLCLCILRFRSSHSFTIACGVAYLPLFCFLSFYLQFFFRSSFLMNLDKTQFLRPYDKSKWYSAYNNVCECVWTPKIFMMAWEQRRQRTTARCRPIFCIPIRFAVYRTFSKFKSVCVRLASEHWKSIEIRFGSTYVEAASVWSQTQNHLLSPISACVSITLRDGWW